MRHQSAAEALTRYEMEATVIPGLKNSHGPIVNPALHGGFRLGFVAGYDQRGQDAAMVDETRPMAELVEARGNFAEMTQEASRLEALLEARATSEGDAALRIAFLEERVLELQLALQRARSGWVTRTSNRDTIREVLGAADNEPTLDAAERVVDERDAAIADYRPSGVHQAQLAGLLSKLRAAGLGGEGDPWQAIAAAVDVLLANAAAAPDREMAVRNQERSIRDADLKVLHAKLVQHGAHIPELPMFDAVMAAIGDLGERASRTLPGSAGRTGDGQLAAFTADIIGALSLDRAETHTRPALVIRVRDLRISEANITRRLQSLRASVADAVGIVTGTGEYTDAEMIETVRAVRDDAQARYTTTGAIQQRVANYPGGALVEKVHNLVIAATRPLTRSEARAAYRAGVAWCDATIGNRVPEVVDSAFAEWAAEQSGVLATMSRERAIEIARGAAYTTKPAPSYVIETPREEFVPHEWVVAAVLTASAGS